MKKQDFFVALEDYLEITNVNESYELELTSINILSVIALVDENFDMQFKAVELKSIKIVQELMNLIGVEKFED